MKIYAFIATAPMRMEQLLAEELRNMGALEVIETRTGASFRGPIETGYRACLWSRLANRILLPLANYPAATPEELYLGAQQVDWAQHFDVSNSFAVACNSSRSQISHSHFAALKIKDAIVDQFRERQDARPSIRLEQPDIQINLYLFQDHATLSLDLSGESLHRRGYREEGMSAPLKENLAAAILLRAGWPEIAANGGALIDPMCGSGTLPIEAALLAADIAPGLLRSHWGFLHWKQHDQPLWNSMLIAARERRESGLAQLPVIIGCDHDPKAVRAARANLDRAGLSGRLQIEQRDLSVSVSQINRSYGLLVTNPPYGERLGHTADLPALYQQLGSELKQHLRGWRAAVFTGKPELGKSLGLRARKIYSLFNGAMECNLLCFEVAPEWFVNERRFPTPLPAASRSEGANALANRLQKNMKHLSRWLKRERVTCFRLYDADLPEYALAIDCYEAIPRQIHVQEYQAPANIDPRRARLRLREALGVILDTLEIAQEQLHFKVRKQQKGVAQYEKLGSSGKYYAVEEGECRFLVNFDDYLDTGLFLDHRLTRRILEELASGRDFLNLFAYTGTASVYAAKGGAPTTTTIDMSNTYLQWAQRNMALNGFDSAEHRFIRADCVEWLRQGGDGRKYGLIFLDPPSFSTSKRMSATLDLQRDHVELIHNTAALLQPDGIMIFSNNLRSFRMQRERLSNLLVEDISRSTLPPDFQRNSRIHNVCRIRLKSGSV
ncbi:MAG: bifunctional 23S rRNA (guanine(2069)-N(7))-methyltransferase RlmK/23S rRNA (guanine(2445)-N(2))-methyltransferase RlmL [Gammaproteobacteria bacterium]|nr:bifunctional 23S rRNA (guanine(2069)-N(7))-methyltransferase RlmK/23S rRNA (guanine(2445)-N(2))-methyltransferase RlmL [Gammaproteobacteria bacterium]MCP5416009.1 bifunctional 23S rRNA (guanine(2069)-N(7))-methyltransferase RlmK/23S rRNA (guanine(2445)-N(2))-methyltransferase RlmL [Chromatiaceae bacterium]